MEALRPLTDEEHQRAGFVSKPALWKHRLEAGAQVRSGNTDSTDVTVGYHAQRQSQKSELTAEIGAAYGKTEGDRTAERAHARGRLELFHTERFFSFSLLALEHDALEDLDLRAQEQAGVGYKFILTSHTLVQGEVGFGLREELFANGESEIEPVGRIGGMWTQKIGAASELAVSAALLPDLIDHSEYRMEGEASMSTPITNRFLLRFRLMDSFDSDPQPGVKKNDFTLLSSLVWTF
jgi:putative salt-induced outer membrane protein YdiY